MPGHVQLALLLYTNTGIIAELDHIADYDGENPAIHSKEAQRREPETGDKCRVAQELELVALL